ncbi:MAG: hypothetical protein AVDCRST_MAG45-1000 [uncultured Solirubrobacterales bacterium]|uniref:MucB/RseB N-terminal domain-containing protein n=1 Tax=uncultured Solirubrobacterales bacterium TaxID=768556 RepID=A0A6J4SDG2_9ACTN|nr:MAG: hypothetical protein AVDCRST_MAG45-1000 [uncultured Solirubrobacterales bacterium]
MSRIRSLSRARLTILVVALAGLAVTAAVASAALGGGETPPPRPLAEAVQRAVTAPPPAGVSARIEFANRLLPAGALPEGEAPPLLAGASGRLWARPDGRMRLELQSRRGDAQVASDGRALTLYDASSKTVYRAEMPKGEKSESRRGEDRRRPPTLAEIERKLARLSERARLSGARPESRAGRPAYSVRVAPRNDGGLLGAAEIAWDAVRGVPLRAAVYAKGETEPVLDLSVTDVSYDAVPLSDVAVEPPVGTRVVRVDSPGEEGDERSRGKKDRKRVTGLAAVRKALPFGLAAPEKLASLPRREVRLIAHEGRPGALVIYGRGLAAIAVIEQPAQRSEPRDERGGGREDVLRELPEISVDGAKGTKLATALGTLIRFERDGVAYAVAGSVPPATAEAAARELR